MATQGQHAQQLGYMWQEATDLMQQVWEHQACLMEEAPVAAIQYTQEHLGLVHGVNAAPQQELGQLLDMCCRLPKHKLEECMQELWELGWLHDMVHHLSSLP